MKPPGFDNRGVVALLLAGSVLAVYWQVGSHPFITLDDPDYVTRNPRVLSGLTPEGIRWAFTTVTASNWHPLTWLSHMLDVSLFGPDAGWHHRVNALFHLANAILLFLALLRMTGKMRESGFVAALFALHPLHVESVAWISERKDLLCAFFWMWTLLAYASYAARGGAGRYLRVILSFALALLSKPMAVTLPFVLLLLDGWPLGRTRLAAPAAGTGPAREVAPGFLLLEKAPLFLLSALACGATLYAQKAGGMVVPLEFTSLGTRAGNALASWAGYLGKAAWPHPLAILYPYEAIPGWQVAGSALLLAALTLLSFRAARRSPFLLAGWLWYLGTLVPVIGLVQVGMQPMADRYTYLPLIGVFVAATWGISGLTRDWAHRKAILAVSGTALLVLLAFLSWRQAAVWRSSVALFRHAVETTPNNLAARFDLENALALEGKPEEALAHFQEALKLGVMDPDSADAHFNLGIGLGLQGKIEEAAQQFREALRVRPGYAEAHCYLGISLRKLGRIDESVLHLREALRLRPEYAEANYHLGMALGLQDRLEESIMQFRAALNAGNDTADTRLNLGVALFKAGQKDEAVAQLREAVRISPGYGQAHITLGSILEDRGRVDEAVGEYREALRLMPGDPELSRRLDAARSRRR